MEDVETFSTWRVLPFGSSISDGMSMIKAEKPASQRTET
jgi:hypothetical protein